MSIPDDTLATLRALNDLDLGALAFFATHTDPHILLCAIVGRYATFVLPDDVNNAICINGGPDPVASLGAKVRVALDSCMTIADALTLTKPLRAAMGWAHHGEPTAEQLIAEAVAALNEYPAKVQAANARAEKAETLTTLWAAKCDLAKTLRAECARQTERAEQAEAALASQDAATLGKPDEPITVARALLKQAASEQDPAQRLALMTEARQWAALDR